MAIRTFIDSAERTWDVWEVNASLVDRRKLRDRRKAHRSTLERRVVAVVSWLVVRRKGSSWLVLAACMDVGVSHRCPSTGRA